MHSTINTGILQYMGRALLPLAAVVLLALPSPPSPKVSCVAKNVGATIIENKKLTETDDWYCDCTIKVNDLQIFAATLPLAHPATWEEAMGAITEFRTKKAPEIVKEWRKGEKQ